MIKIIVTILLFTSCLFASYEDGKKLFTKHCASCHGSFISLKDIKENFFQKDNQMLKLKAPTQNMLVYAILNGPKKIGEDSDIEMRQIEIEEYLKDYLYEPNIEHSICDPIILKYYDKKEPLKVRLDDEQITDLAQFFLFYKENNPHLYETQKKASSLSLFDEENIFKQANLQNKRIIVYVYSDDCYYCIKMKKILTDPQVKEAIEKDFILFETNVDKHSLPFDLDKKYKKITPTFFIFSADKDFFKMYPGAWKKDDFLQILNETRK